MKDLITVKEAAEILRVSNKQIYHLCEQRLLPHIRLGAANKGIRIDREELDKWIEAHHEKAEIHPD